MKLSLKPHHLKRYKDIALLFWKYGTSDLAKEFETEDLKGDDQSQPGSAGQSKPEELADDLEKMGPTFVKFGQLLSSRPDLLPEPYLKALARLQDKVKPFPYSEVEQIVASELGVRISKAFSFFDQKHLAAAYRKLRMSGFSTSNSVRVLKRYAEQAELLEDTDEEA